MDFQLTDDQTLLQATAQRFVREKYDFAQRSKLLTSDRGFSDEHWKMFADMGWLALPIAEENGGLGGGVADVAVLAEVFGNGLIVEPFVASVVLGARAAEAFGTAEQRDRILPSVAEGKMKLAFAYAEASCWDDIDAIETVASPGSSGYSLTGEKITVLAAESADHLIVIARVMMDGVSSGLKGFLVDANASGVHRQDYRTVDGGRASDIRFSDTPCELLGDTSDDFRQALQRVIDVATSALCSEAVGAMAAAFEMTREYTMTRNQFGRAISDNQVVQHRLADMHIALQEAQALAAMTALKLDRATGCTMAEISALKAKIGQSSNFIGEHSIQLHGGIGMTDEYPIGHYYKRLLAICALLGDTDFHLNRIGQGMISGNQ